MVKLSTLRNLGVASATSIALGLSPSLVVAEGTSTSTLTGEQSAIEDTVLLDEMNLGSVIQEATNPLKAIDWSGLLELDGKPDGENAKAGGADVKQAGKGAFFRDMIDGARSLQRQPLEEDGEF